MPKTDFEGPSNELAIQTAEKLDLLVSNSGLEPIQYAMMQIYYWMFYIGPFLTFHGDLESKIAQMAKHIEAEQVILADAGLIAVTNKKYRS